MTETSSQNMVGKDAPFGIAWLFLPIIVVSLYFSFFNWKNSNPIWDVANILVFVAAFACATRRSMTHVAWLLTIIGWMSVLISINGAWNSIIYTNGPFVSDKLGDHFLSAAVIPSIFGFATIVQVFCQTGLKFAGLGFFATILLLTDISLLQFMVWYLFLG